MENVESIPPQTRKFERVEVLRVFFIYFFCFLGLERLWDSVAARDLGHSRIFGALIFAGLMTYLAPVTIGRKAK